MEIEAERIICKNLVRQISQAMNLYEMDKLSNFIKANSLLALLPLFVKRFSGF